MVTSLGPLWHRDWSLDDYGSVVRLPSRMDTRRKSDRLAVQNHVVSPSTLTQIQGVLTTCTRVCYFWACQRRRWSLNRSPPELERWLSGRKRRFAKPLYCESGIGGSNPPLSAEMTSDDDGSCPNSCKFRSSGSFFPLSISVVVIG